MAAGRAALAASSERKGWTVATKVLAAKRKGGPMRAILRKSGDVSGWVLGYDPGGNDKHGVAALQVQGGQATRLCAATCSTSGEAVGWLVQYPEPLAVGFDTLLAWSSARSGDRPADRALRAHYPEVAASVVYPNALYGAMCVNGALVARRLADKNPTVVLRFVETHTKVMYFALAVMRYDWQNQQGGMVSMLTAWLGLEHLEIHGEHAYDAALSAYAALEDLRGNWPFNLLDLPPNGERLVFPVGPATYPWPAEVPPAPL